MFVAFLLAIELQVCSGQSIHAAAKTANVADHPSAYESMHAFNEHRDAVADIHSAIAEAQRTHKRILLYLGGDWCPYCAELNTFFQANPNLLAIRDAHFITVYVYYGHGDHNDKALAPYGKFIGIPHYFVLDSDGKLLHSEHLIELRANGRYNPAKMQAFLDLWATHP